jgi:hypothetical protein
VRFGSIPVLRSTGYSKNRPRLIEDESQAKLLPTGSVVLIPATENVKHPHLLQHAEIVLVEDRHGSDRWQVALARLATSVATRETDSADR